jgi:hypothetical protein
VPTVDGDEQAGEPATAIFVVAGTDARVEVQRLSRLLAAAEPSEVVCDVSRLPANLDAVETIARLRLAAKRSNVLLRVSRAAGPLTDLVAAIGLDDALALGE